MKAEGGLEARMIVSEPLGNRLPGAWNEVPRTHFGIVHEGEDVFRPFNPRT